MKFLILCSALSLLLGSESTLAQPNLPVASTAKPAKLVITETAIDEDDVVPDVLQSMTFDYRCELKDFMTIYTNVDDNDHIALRWKSHLYRLHRVATTTGANRFENKKAGLLWNGIPAKSMLLDSRHAIQLANECKTAGQ